MMDMVDMVSSILNAKSNAERQEKWDRRFLQMALLQASWSKDTSTQVGCVIVGPNREVRSTGYNGMPRGVRDGVEARHVRPAKYLYMEHGERNALYNAARVGVPTEGCTLYVTSTPLKFPPCADCARAIIQCGIVRVVQEPHVGDMTRWAESCAATMEMFAEAGIRYAQVSLESSAP
jgi:dCMP deaminase